MFWAGLRGSFCQSQQEGNVVSLITGIGVSFRSGGDVKDRDMGNSTKITLKNGRCSCALGNHDGSQELYSPPTLTMAASQIPLSRFWSLRNALSFELAFSWCLLHRDKSETSADSFLKLKNYFISGSQAGNKTFSVPHILRVSWENVFHMKELTFSH